MREQHREVVGTGARASRRAQELTGWSTPKAGSEPRGVIGRHQATRASEGRFALNNSPDVVADELLPKPRSLNFPFPGCKDFPSCKRPYECGDEHQDERRGDQQPVCVGSPAASKIEAATARPRIKKPDS